MGFPERRDNPGRFRSAAVEKFDIVLQPIIDVRLNKFKSLKKHVHEVRDRDRGQFFKDLVLNGFIIRETGSEHISSGDET